jgi:hypothetical protein
MPQFDLCDRIKVNQLIKKSFGLLCREPSWLENMELCGKKAA